MRGFLTWRSVSLRCAGRLAAPEDLVDTTEMDLKAVLELEEEGAVAMRARLAECFGHSRPIVQQTVSRMQRDDLLVIEADRRLRFTDRGRARAMSVMRKHRLAEVFFDRVVRRN
ncbi:hypothetical protein ATY41_11080 [Leifsonia xyli subsp. xyli]|uniref:HTH dtxR-type domain-containing protein n=1 Tax=Leifsonia xyli subsp. xyli TaxID=59736 RepID=A0A1E2SJY3_LEIXY|nr:hypothetical protein ATY41_11080 [Leifsonia xyli subsp. xyli]